jgi:hypothetical protein
LKRHERFNGLTKAFDCLSGRFRHSVDRFGNCFETVCVICQYQIEMDCPLFEVLIEELMEDKYNFFFANRNSIIHFLTTRNMSG